MKQAKMLIIGRLYKKHKRLAQNSGHANVHSHFNG